MFINCLVVLLTLGFPSYDYWRFYQWTCDVISQSMTWLVTLFIMFLNVISKVYSLCFWFNITSFTVLLSKPKKHCHYQICISIYLTCLNSTTHFHVVVSKIFNEVLSVPGFSLLSFSLTLFTIYGLNGYMVTLLYTHPILLAGEAGRCSICFSLTCVSDTISMHVFKLLWPFHIAWVSQLIADVEYLYHEWNT